jgi:hypothetical protein
MQSPHPPQEGQSAEAPLLGRGMAPRRVEALPIGGAALGLGMDDLGIADRGSEASWAGPSGPTSFASIAYAPADVGRNQSRRPSAET